MSTALILNGRRNANASFRKGVYYFTENSVNFRTAAGSLIWMIRYPVPSALKKTESKMPK